jgi:hypothetical protein
VKHIVLGYMHTWLEGVLEHQLHTLWGIGRSDEKAKVLEEVDKEEQWVETDLNESASELEELQEEQEVYQDEEMFANFCAAYNASQGSSEVTSVPESFDTPMGDDVDANDDGTDDDDEFHDVAFQGSWSFTSEMVQQVRTCIAEVTLPTWVSRPPTNLGELKHGKLKADNFLILFTVILPLLLPQMVLSDDASRNAELLKSFFHIVAATNIIVSFKTSNLEAEAYTENYLAYCNCIQNLFPNVKELPKHHYAMHYEALLKYWGPMAALSEFPGERINGMLQKIKTNKHLCMYSMHSVT